MLDFIGCGLAAGAKKNWDVGSDGQLMCKDVIYGCIYVYWVYPSPADGQIMLLYLYLFLKSVHMYYIYIYIIFCKTYIPVVQFASVFYISLAFFPLTCKASCYPYV